MQIILTGYSGFLGKIIESTCKNRGRNIIKLGRNKDADVVWDFLSSAPTLPQSEVVIHCAGFAHKKIDFKYRDECFKINFFATRNLCEAFKLQNKIPEK